MKVSDLEAMDRDALIAAWAAVIRTPVPKGLSRTLLRRFVATELQLRRQGGLPAALRKALLRPDAEPARPRSDGLRPGGRLLRDWNGVTHVVEIAEAGFLWNGATHRSLSAIAREITGAHWSGPRFFGLNGRPKP